MNTFTPIRFEAGRPMLLGGLRKYHAFAEADTGIAAQWEEFLLWRELPGLTGTIRYGVMCGHDAAGFEYMCGVEVEAFERLPEGTGRIRVPAQRYAVFTHTGNGSSLRSTWMKIFAWLESGPWASAHKPDFERYDLTADPLTGTGEIEIGVGVVPRDYPDTRAHKHP
jgi:AraC family transcriptional regulator